MYMKIPVFLIYYNLITLNSHMLTTKIADDIIAM